MLDPFGPEVWITSLALSCAVGWLLGDRGRIASEEQHDIAAGQDCGGDGFFTTTVIDPQPRASALCDESLANARSPGFAVLDDGRLAIFADMPSLDDLHAHIDAIRLQGKIWDAPDLEEQIDALIGAPMRIGNAA